LDLPALSCTPLSSTVRRAHLVSGAASLATAEEFQGGGDLPIREHGDFTPYLLLRLPAQGDLFLV
jgi:hypothetical protein